MKKCKEEIQNLKVAPLDDMFIHMEDTRAITNNLPRYSLRLTRDKSLDTTYGPPGISALLG